MKNILRLSTAIVSVASLCNFSVAQNQFAVETTEKKPEVPLSSFVSIRPFAGVSLELPKTWQVIDGQTTQEVIASVESISGSKWTPPPSGVKAFKPPIDGIPTNVTLICRSGKFPSQEWLSAQKPEDLEKLNPDIESGLRKMTAGMGLSLKHFSGVTTVRIGEKVGLKYTATAVSGEISISLEQLDIPDSTRQVSFVGSDKLGVSIWKPVIAHAISTLHVDSK